MEKTYASQRGLKVLNHIGIKLTESEKDIFEASWQNACNEHGGHFLSTVCEAYSQIGKNTDERKTEFAKKLNSTELEYWMNE